MKTIIKQCLGNRSLVYYKQEKWEQAIQDCSIILGKFDPAFKKALLRRGVCYNQIEKYDLAIKDLQALTQVEPSNEEAKKELNKAMAGFTQKIAKEKKERENQDKQEKLRQYEAKKAEQEKKVEDERKAQEERKAEEGKHKKQKES